ncbi:hypothetical protein F5Y18DRAFT_394013 [Xylariaceae sp. FL1019]|nr:hypothetical protein F5Y18DRAFT_394013 [Xylariaceae sp. FL1019]
MMTSQRTPPQAYQRYPINFGLEAVASPLRLSRSCARETRIPSRYCTGLCHTQICPLSQSCSETSPDSKPDLILHKFQLPEQSKRNRTNSHSSTNFHQPIGFVCCHCRHRSSGIYCSNPENLKCPHRTVPRCRDCLILFTSAWNSINRLWQNIDKTRNDT